MPVDFGNSRSVPPGIMLITRIKGQNLCLNCYRYLVLIVTFIAYACYHASRKPSSIVKSVLDPHPEKVHGDFNFGKFLFGFHGHDHEEGWYPFNGKFGTSKLGETDVAFLACYSLGMFVAGHLGDRLDLRLFLASGMLWSGVFVCMFGMGYFWDIHIFWYYLVMQMIAGLFQATGWPSVVAVVGNWCGKRKRGLIMGVWNAHTSVGNICGSLLAACVLDYGWGWSFILPGLAIAFGGILVFLFLPASPDDVGLLRPPGSVGTSETMVNIEENQRLEGISAEEDLLSHCRTQNSWGSMRGVGLLEACAIPGVIPFALCLFFAKLVAYTFLYWLPFYLSQTEIGGKYIDVKTAGNTSTLFDVGGIVGGVLAGYISDKLKARATTAATFMYAAVPAILLYRAYGHISQTLNIVLMMMAGLFVNGPYALITTAVSADLGTHPSLSGDSRALATVTAIIDGTGSVGAALGPLMTGFLSTKGWDTVFCMLTVGALIAGLLLSNLVIAEMSERFCRPDRPSSESQAPEDSASRPLLNNKR